MRTKHARQQNNHFGLIFFFQRGLTLRTFYAYYTQMGKEATNLTLPGEVKRKGIALAKKAGMSLSTYVAQLLIKEAAREQGFIKESPALYAAGRSQAKTRTKRT